MTTLTQTAYLTRKIIKYGLIGLVAFLVLRFLWEVTSAYLKKINPPPPPPPTVTFGKLPPLSFPKKENLPELTFQLETIEGTLPKLESIAKVYFMPKPVANLLALDRAKELARKMGFRSEPMKISERIYRFTGENTLSSLEMDIISQKFKLTYDFSNDPEVFSEKKLPNNEQAIWEAKSFLRQTDLLSPDLENGQTKVSYFRFAAPSILPAISLSEADFVRVDLFRANLEGWKIFPPEPGKSLVSFVFSGARSPEKRIIEANYFYHPLSRENFATYPLKTANDAWQELVAQKGYLASLGENPQGKIIIRKVYLAYYESEESQNFLQPIFVFEGDRGFLAYVPAIESKWGE